MYTMALDKHVVTSYWVQGMERGKVGWGTAARPLEVYLKMLCVRSQGQYLLF